MTDSQLLIEGITKDIIGYLITDYGLSLHEALQRFYRSATCHLLQDPRTGLYLQSSGYVYTFLQNELTTGKVQ